MLYHIALDVAAPVKLHGAVKVAAASAPLPRAAGRTSRARSPNRKPLGPAFDGDDEPCTAQRMAPTPIAAIPTPSETLATISLLRAALTC